jgi:hypothetical protein
MVARHHDAIETCHQPTKATPTVLRLRKRWRHPFPQVEIGGGGVNTIFDAESDVRIEDKR